MRTSLNIYLILFVCLLITELLIATVFKGSILRPVFGDFLVTPLLYTLARGAINLKPMTTSFAVLLFAYLIEFGQYINIREILGIKKHWWNELILGTSFDWLDILAYTLGIICIYVLDKFILLNKNKEYQSIT